jgi:DNA-binding transcriptional LysR family regulator
VASGKLVRVLEPFAPTSPGVFLYYPGSRQMTPKLRAFVDHVKIRAKAADRGRTHTDEKRTKLRRA